MSETVTASGEGKEAARVVKASWEWLCGLAAAVKGREGFVWGEGWKIVEEAGTAVGRLLLEVAERGWDDAPVVAVRS